MKEEREAGEGQINDHTLIDDSLFIEVINLKWRFYDDDLKTIEQAGKVIKNKGKSEVNTYA